MKQYTVGVDVGGTNIKLGIISPSGKIIARHFLDTKKYHLNKDRLIDALVLGINSLLGARNLGLKNIVGVGFGLPGLIDSRKGIVNFLPNVPGWYNVPLRKILEKKLRMRVILDNDVNVITLGEWKYGAGKGSHNMLCLTLGTGVGGGLVFNNALYRGEGNAAGELGHIPLNEKGPVCNCGGWGCFERYVGNGILRAKAAKIFKNKNIILPDVRRLAVKGDPKAIRFWEDAAEHIGNVLVGVVNLLNPRLIVIGGGVSNNYKFLGATIKRVIRRRAMKVQAKMVKVVRAKLGDDAGIIGAHVLVKEEIGEC